jgi:hypothetical protein
MILRWLKTNKATTHNRLFRWFDFHLLFFTFLLKSLLFLSPSFAFFGLLLRDRLLSNFKKNS